MTECILKGRQVITLSPEREFMVEYYQTKCQDEENGLITYGVSVRKKEKENEEMETISGITQKEEVAEELLKRLYENTVTPVSLVYVVDDFITEKCNS